MGDHISEKALVKTVNTTLTAAVVLAMGAAAPGQASDSQLVDVASGGMIEEGEAIMLPGNAIAGKHEVAMERKAVPRWKKAAPIR